jgi:hypothetical protein
MYNFSVGLYDMLFDEESLGHFRIISFFTGRWNVCGSDGNCRIPLRAL